MNPRCPTERLTAAEAGKLRTLVDSRGEEGARSLVGISAPIPFLRACLGLPVSRLTVLVIRDRLDRI